MERERKKKRVAEVTSVVELKDLKPNEVPPMMLKFEHNRNLVAEPETIEYFASVLGEDGPQSLKKRRTLADDSSKRPIRRSVKCHDASNPGTTYSPVEPSIGQGKGPVVTLGPNPIKRRFLAVRNRRDNTVKLVEIQPFVLSPDLWRRPGVGVTIYEDYPEGDDADRRRAEALMEGKEEELTEKQKKLIMSEKTIMEFGSKRKQRSLAASKRGAKGALSAADMEDVSSQIANADAIVSATSEVEAKEYEDVMFPPCNREATDVAQVYSWEEVMGADMVEKLRAVLPEQLKSEEKQLLSTFNIEQIYKTCTIPPSSFCIQRMAHVFKVCATTSKTEEGRQRREMMLSGALFMDLLVFMLKTSKIQVFQDATKWPSWVSEEIQLDMMDFFLERGFKTGKDTFVKNKAAETKIAAYMMVMELLLGNFKFMLTELTKICGLKPALLKIIAHRLGAQSIGSGGKEFILLKLPLVKQEAATGFKRRR